MFQFPPLVAVVVPSEASPSNNSTVLFFSAVPLNPSAVVLLVMLSLLETPVSSPVLRSGVEGAAGGVWSIVIVTVVPEPVFGPLPLVTLAVMVPV